MEELVFRGSNMNGAYHGQGMLLKRGAKWLEGLWARGVFKRGQIFNEEGAKVGEQHSASSYQLGSDLFDGNVQLGNGTRVYSGATAKGKPHGFGTGYFRSGCERYVGNWKHGKREGPGKGFVESGAVLHDGVWSADHYWRDTQLFDQYGHLVYRGESRNGKPNGVGTLYAGSSVAYEGSFLVGIKTGWGCQYKNGALDYEGEFKKGKEHGWGIQYYLQDGLKKRYQGHFVNGCRCGAGQQFFHNQTVRFSGAWKDNLLTDFGTEFYSNGSVRYLGTFQNGAYHGKGILMNSTGAILYDGEWADGAKNGRGKIFGPGGNMIYGGEFVRDMFHGVGKFTEEDVVYEGDFAQNMFHGRGVLTDRMRKFEGGFYFGTFDGDGKLFEFASGREYVGKWVNGVIHAGTVKTADGAEATVKRGGFYRIGNAEYVGSAKLYEGDWLNDDYHGEGTMYLANGQKRCVGTFDRGKFLGGKITISSGERTLYEGGGKWDSQRHDVVRDGKGSEFDTDGVETFVGEWQDDRRHGLGVQTLRPRELFVGGSRLIFGADVRVQQTWAKGQPRGAALFILPSGAVFKRQTRGDVVGVLVEGSSKRPIKHHVYADLQCGICYENMGVGEREPWALDCGHVFCKGCLTKMRDGVSTRCPMDRAICASENTRPVVVELALTKTSRI